MEDIDSFWTFQENVDELKQRLQYTTYELEITRKETNEEKKKNNDQIKGLLQLLQTTCKERDETKSQLKKLRQLMSFNSKPNNLIDNSHQFNPTPVTTTTAFPSAPFSPDSPLLTSHFPTKTNSSITESSSLSLETQNNNNNNSNSNNYTQSHVSSPDSSNIVSTTTTTTSSPIVMASTSMKPTTNVVDQESLIIANLAKGRPLPQKGKLLQAVLESGPLLSTLMVAGSLPQWRNPPGVLTHQIPPVNLKGCGVVINQSPGCNKYYNTSQTSLPPCNITPLQSINDIGVMGHNNNVTTSGNSAMYNGHVTSSSGPFGVCPSSLLDFGGVSSAASCFMGGRMMMNSSVSFECQIPKRQRIL